MKLLNQLVSLEYNLPFFVKDIFLVSKETKLKILLFNLYLYWICKYKKLLRYEQKTISKYVFQKINNRFVNKISNFLQKNF